MIRKQMTKLLMSAVALVLLIGAATTMVRAATPGYGPDTALTPSGDWTVLEPGEIRWYTFHYDYDQETDEATDSVVRLEVAETDSASFEVWTPRNVRQWINQEDDWDPTGAGTKLSDVTDEDADDKILVWANRGSVSETFYVIVKNERSQSTHVKLTIRGKDVSFPSQLVEAVPVEQMVASEHVEAVETVTASPVEVAPVVATNAAAEAVVTEPQSVELALTVTGGTGPDDALAMSADTGELAPGESRWYRFKYDDGRVESDDTPETAQVRLRMEEIGCMAFEIWTPRNIQQWINNEDDWEPVGGGTVLDYDANDGEDDDGKRDESTLVWLGSSTAPETFYVIVENVGNSSCSYSLTIQGPTVSF